MFCLTTTAPEVGVIVIGVFGDTEIVGVAALTLDTPNAEIELHATPVTVDVNT